MFVGHFAAAFALGSRSRVVPLPALLAGTAFLDLLFAALGAAGIERSVVHEPPIFANLELIDLGYSHSLIGSLLWSALAMGLGRALWKSNAAGLLLAASVFSHYVLDVVSHRPDMAVVGFGSPVDWRIGTGLAAWPLPFFLVEAGWSLWAVHAWDPSNRRLFRTLIVLLALWSNQVFGFYLPRAPSPVEAAGITAFAFAAAGLALAWAAHRPARPADPVG